MKVISFNTTKAKNSTILNKESSLSESERYVIKPDHRQHTQKEINDIRKQLQKGYMKLKTLS